MLGIRSRLSKLPALPGYLLSRPRAKVLVFIHLPKCAGTSLTSVLKANYNPWRTYAINVSGGRRAGDGSPFTFESTISVDRDRILRTLQRRQEQLDCIVGHIPYGVHRHIRRECMYVSLVRDPVSRVWSQFNHIVNKQEHYLHPLLARFGFDLVKILQSGEAFEFCNDQARMLLGSARKNLSNADGESVLRLVEEEFFYINTAEGSRKGIDALGARLGWSVASYPEENVGEYKRLAAEPDRAVVEAIREHNEIDQAVYEHVRAKMSGAA